MHAHHLIQIGMSKDESIKIRTSTGSTYSRCRCVVVDSDVSHQIVCASSTPIVFLWIDPESDRARRLRAALPRLQSAGILLNAEDPVDLGDRSPRDCDEAASLRRRILARLGADEAEPQRLDKRVMMVIDEIASAPHMETPPIERLAEVVHLSPSRLMHLFGRQVGIPIRRYSLWRRVMTAIRIILDGKNLTEAALEAGFSDAAHMSRTFKDMFGVSPSMLFKNSRFVQASAC